MSTSTILENTIQIDKRRHARQPLNQEVTVTIGQWPRSKRFQAKIINAGSNGLGLKLIDGTNLPAGENATIRWNAPPCFHGKNSAIESKMKGVVVHNGNHGQAGIRFHRLVHEHIKDNPTRWHKVSTIAVIAALMLLVCLLKTRNIVSFWYSPLVQLYSFITAAYVISRIGLSSFYREPGDNGILKSISIVISVKNEEDHIAQTVEQCFNFNYPANLLEVVIVDDGSTDRTWDVLTQMREKYPHLKLFRFEKNLGKRHGMAMGAQNSSGEILVFMDSDVLVESEGLYRIIQPFVDPSIGAVAGHTSVIIQPKNIISKIESVRYFVSQRIMKAAESLFGAVTCCPGPFSAYRRQAMLDVLEPWLNQTFLGAKATFGDDRSLTNFILRKYKVIYHAGARCSTYVPESWPVFIRQQLRWKKSWLRETTIAVRFMFRENIIAALSYYAGVIISMASPLILLRAFTYAPFFLQQHNYLQYLGGLFLVFLMLGIIYYYHTGSRYWYYGLLYAIVYSGFFSLQTYYALVTVRRNHWGTR